MIITYRSSVDIISADRIGDEFELFLNPYRFPIPDDEEEFAVARSMDKRTRQYTHVSSFRTGLVEARRIPLGRLAQLREFVKSAARGQSFEINPQGWHGHPSAGYPECFLTNPSTAYNYDGHNLLGCTFRFELSN